MTTYRAVHDKNNPYFMLNRAAANDKRLSYRAIGIHTYLMSKTDEWEANETDIVKRHTEGREAVRAALKELKAAGYMRRSAIKNEKGQVTRWVMDVYEVPTDPGPDDGDYIDDEEDEPDTGKPHSGKPESGKPECGKPDDGKPDGWESPTSNYKNKVSNEHRDKSAQPNAAKKKSSRGAATQPSLLPTDIPMDDEPIVDKVEEPTEAKETSTLSALSLADRFRALHAELQTSSNKQALLRDIYTLCYGEAEAPTFSRLGMVARKVGGAGRLADLLWQYTSRPPTGDILSYLEKVHRNREQDAQHRAPEVKVSKGKAFMRDFQGSEA